MTQKEEFRLLESPSPHNVWNTSMGAWLPMEGRVVFRGRNLFEDLNDLSWMALLLLGITGRIFDSRQLRLFEGVWSLCASYPDPRLWNNRVAALAGTTRSTAALGVAAASAVSEASVYGGRPEIRAIDFLLRARRKLNQGAALVDIVKDELTNHRVIAGFGRPIRREDERIKPLMVLAETLGFSGGTYVELVFRVEELLKSIRLRFQMNIAGLTAALAADQGMSAREFYNFLVLCFSAGIVACHVDANTKREGTLFRLNGSPIGYGGAPNRSWDSDHEIQRL